MNAQQRPEHRRYQADAEAEEILKSITGDSQRCDPQPRPFFCAAHALPQQAPQKAYIQHKGRDAVLGQHRQVPVVCAVKGLREGKPRLVQLLLRLGVLQQHLTPVFALELLFN